MKRRVEDWSIEKLYKERAQISFPEYQRQPNLWPTEKKALLIDSILKDIDIPKLYFNRTNNGNHEVVDGQQRLWAIWEFLDGQYSYKQVGGGAKHFNELGSAEKRKIRSYTLQVTILEDASDDYLRELFLRLQLGLLLITGEKLNAASGEMKAFIFGKLVRHVFIEHLGIPERRFPRETLCAQICINSFSREKQLTFARTRYDDLKHFFDEYASPQGVDREFFRGQTKVVVQTLDALWECFGNHTSTLKNRSYILSIYLFYEELLKGGQQQTSAKARKEFASFTLTLWERLREEISAGIDRTNRELYAFETLLSSAPGEKYQIERRHNKLREYYSYFKKTGKIKGDS